MELCGRRSSWSIVYGYGFQIKDRRYKTILESNCEPGVQLVGDSAVSCCRISAAAVFYAFCNWMADFIHCGAAGDAA